MQCSYGFLIFSTGSYNNFFELLVHEHTSVRSKASSLLANVLKHSDELYSQLNPYVGFIYIFNFLKMVSFSALLVYKRPSARLFFVCRLPFCLSLDFSTFCRN